MRAGDLDRMVTVERYTATEDSLGGEVRTWGTLATVPAQVMPISDGERWRAGEVAATVTTRFRIRWGLGVTVRDRVVFEGRAYDVVAVKEIGRAVGQEISAGARAE